LEPADHHQTVGGLSFWLTPVNSFEAERPVCYFLVFLNPALPEMHPMRALAFIYNSATKEILWV